MNTNQILKLTISGQVSHNIIDENHDMNYIKDGLEFLICRNKGNILDTLEEFYTEPSKTMVMNMIKIMVKVKINRDYIGDETLSYLSELCKHIKRQLK